MRALIGIVEEGSIIALNTVNICMLGVYDLGRSSGTPKSVLIATRVTPRISALIQQMADREGLYVSEWVRKLITAELASRGVLDKGLFTPREYENNMKDGNW
jgi:hypothetical protein